MLLVLGGSCISGCICTSKNGVYCQGPSYNVFFFLILQFSRMQLFFYYQLIFASKAVLTPVIKVVKNLSIGKIFKIIYSSILNIGLLPLVLIVL